jgi:hypothetical protein
LAEKIVDNIGYNIATIFAEKYGDYWEVQKWQYLWQTSKYKESWMHV